MKLLRLFKYEMNIPSYKLDSAFSIVNPQEFKQCPSTCSESSSLRKEEAYEPIYDQEEDEDADEDYVPNKVRFS